jgi:hypothetical protein
MKLRERIFGLQRDRPERDARRNSLILNQALRDVLARVADHPSADHLLAVYRTLLVTEQLFVAVENVRDERVGTTFTIGPDDRIEVQTRRFPETGLALVVYPDFCSAGLARRGMASIPLRDVFQWALDAKMGLVLTNLKSSHSTGGDWFFIPPEHIAALAAGEMPQV